MPTASDLLGVPVGSDDPAFLLALGAHVAAGLTAVVAGGVAAFARKRPGMHPRAGLIYWWGLLWVLVSSLVMAAVRWPHDTHLIIIGVVGFTAGTWGVVVRHRAREGWRELHLVAMGISYVALLTGFYVDNGPHLPAWRLLPRWSFWVLPSVVGAVVMMRSLRRLKRPPARP
jgi:hypothetical protein